MYLPRSDLNLVLQKEAGVPKKVIKVEDIPGLSKFFLSLCFSLLKVEDIPGLMLLSVVSPICIFKEPIVTCHVIAYIIGKWLDASFLNVVISKLSWWMDY